MENLEGRIDRSTVNNRGSVRGDENRDVERVAAVQSLKDEDKALECDSKDEGT